MTNMETANEAQLKVHKHISSLINYLSGEGADDDSSNDFANIVCDSMNLQVKEVHADGSYTVTLSLNPNFEQYE
jgi:hypothetical protein